MVPIGWAPLVSLARKALKHTQPMVTCSREIHPSQLTQRDRQGATVMSLSISSLANGYRPLGPGWAMQTMSIP